MSGELVESLREIIAAKDALIGTLRADNDDLKRRLAATERERDARYTENDVRAAIAKALK